MNHTDAFRNRVIKIATELFPQMEIRPHPQQADVVIAGNTHVGLGNIRDKDNIYAYGEEDFRSMVKQHFDPADSIDIAKLLKSKWADFRDKLFPQIMPAHFVKDSPMPMVSFPLAHSIHVGVVADFPKTYMYIRQEDIERWGLTADEVYQTALANLEKRCKRTEMFLSGRDKNVFVGMASHDSYTAARIVLPKLQQQMASHLGETFRFGIPNRELLICWRVDCDTGFHKTIEETIAEDYVRYPYSLSRSVFVRNSEGNIHEQEKR